MKISMLPRDDTCQFYQLLDMLGKKWMLFILTLLCEGYSTFNAILTRIPKMNSKTLSERLDILCKKGFLLRQVTQSKPLKITYELTPLGKSLASKVKEFGGRFVDQIYKK